MMAKRERYERLYATAKGYDGELLMKVVFIWDNDFEKIISKTVVREKREHETEDRPFRWEKCK